jgi:hypothetical protein
MSLQDKNVVVARAAHALKSVRARLGVATISADVTDETAAQRGEKVVSVLDDPKYAEGFAFGLKGDTGITMLEGEAA